MGLNYSASSNDKTTKNSAMIDKIISGCVKREDKIKLTGDSDTLTFKHYLTFPDTYEGLKLWEGAIVLLRYMQKHPDRFTGKRVMDLGGGMGVVGIAMARFFQSEVTISDYIPKILELAQQNVELNSPYSCQKPEVVHLDWNNCEDYSKTFDIVVGCELVYAITNCDNLVKLLSRILKKGSKLIMIIPTCRTNRQEFLAKIEEIGEFEVKEDILSGDYYTGSPLINTEEDVFYPLRELEFSMLEISFK